VDRGYVKFIFQDGDVQCSSRERPIPQKASLDPAQGVARSKRKDATERETEKERILLSVREGRLDNRGKQLYPEKEAPGRGLDTTNTSITKHMIPSECNVVTDPPRGASERDGTSKEKK